MDEKNGVFHAFTNKKSPPMMLILGVLIVVAGFVCGYFVVQLQGVQQAQSTSGATALSKSTIAVGSTYGSNDTATFKDTAQGTMTNGGIDGEGQYHLVRPGGDSQNVYMTSSIVDLSLFLNRKVKVWGQTQKAQTAGWLMDVGRVQVLQ